MATRAAHQRDTSRARSRDPSRIPPSRERSIDLPRPHGERSASASRAGTKRLFSNRASRISTNLEDQDGDYGVTTTTTYDDDVEDGAHSEKRRRPSDWPLSNNSPPLPAAGTTTTPGRAPLRNKSRNAPRSPPLRRRSSSQVRPSKFVEGSMNDRASMVPPRPYLGTEDDQFGEGNGDGYDGHTRWSRTGLSARKHPHNTDASVAASSSSVAERSSEVSRHSGIFRFGKSLASTFNPSNWKIWSKPQQHNHQHQPVVEDEETAQLRILQERQEKAERIYRELKQAGHQFPAATTSFPQLQEPEHRKSSPAKHDSAVALYDEEVYSAPHSADTSRDEKRLGKVYLELPNLPQNARRGESPASFSGSAAGHSNNSSPTKQPFSLKKASFSNIKKAFTNDSTSNLNEGELLHHHRTARRIPSRKDLQKQQKLVKRVSDLEGKLEAARRQLTESLAEPVPSHSQPPPRIGRNRFVPGALSTLPSERLLSGYVSPEEDASEGEMADGIGRAVTVDHPKEGAAGVPGRRAGSEMTVKLLPRPTKDVVMQSVETDTVYNGMAAAETPRIKIEERASSSASSDLSPPEEEQDQELGQESPPQPQAKPTQKKAMPKKRKSAFEGLADDGGRYKPSVADAESDDGSEMSKKLAVKKKSTTTARPRKLQRVAQAATTSKEPAPARSSRTTTATSIPTPRNRSTSSRLVKSNLHSSRQSMSPPPSSTFTGLNNAKPPTHSSSNSKPTKNSEQLASPTKNSAYMANPAMGGDVPPMPKLPKAVRLASGEVISTATGASQVSAGEGKKKLRKEKPVATRSREKESFEWPADVF